MSLAKNLVNARKKAGLTQAEFAKKLKKSRASICEYESGVHAPKLKLLLKIAALTGVPVEELVA